MDKRHLIYTGIHLVICLLIVKIFHKIPFVRGFLGDLFFMGLLYHMLKSLFNFDMNKLMVFLLLSAFGVEIFQYFKLIDYLGLDNRVLKFLFGATFDFWDLVAYTLGTTFVLWEEKWGK